MNSFSRNTLIALASSALLCTGARATGELENPAQSTAVSGIAVISGWHCSASRVEVEIAGGARIAAASGTDRADAAATCGKRDTGFGLLVNWGILAPGTHTLRVLADGAEFARRTVTVVSLGAEFLRGRSASIDLPDFPSTGRVTVLEWREAAQGFVAREVRDDAPLLAGRWNGANLERRSECTSAQNNGTRGTYAQYDISFESGFMGIAEAGITGLACTYYGPFRQEGAIRTASGTYSCSDGKRGDYTSRGFLVTANEMSIHLDIKLTGKETCTIEALLGGSRF